VEQPMDDRKPQDIFVRAYAIPLEKQKSKNLFQYVQPKWPDYAIIFDCESRITADQTLTFGFWRFCELRNGEYLPLEEGIFHDDKALTGEGVQSPPQIREKSKP
jgi:hypothetical protein